MLLSTAAIRSIALRSMFYAIPEKSGVNDLKWPLSDAFLNLSSQANASAKVKLLSWITFAHTV